MAHDTLTIALEGDVSLEVFATTMQRFLELVTALCDYMDRDTPVLWRIDDLQAGSAEATIRGFSANSELLDKISIAFVNIGEHLHQQDTIPYPENIARPAMALTHVLTDSLPVLRFEAAGQEVSIRARSIAPEASRRRYAWGEVKGTIETLQRRRHQFTLYDTLFDKPVRCRLHPDQQDRMREFWGKKVVVVGRVGRDPMTGYPVEVRDIRDIRLVPTYNAEDYQRAIGAFDLGSEPAEVLVRRLRDAE